MNKINEKGKVTIGQAWKDIWKGYIDFLGISTRAGFWWTALFFVFGTFIIGFINGFIEGVTRGTVNPIIPQFIYYTLSTIILIPLLAAATRRFKDTGLNIGLAIAFLIIYILLRILIGIDKSLLWIVITSIFDIAMIVLLCMPSNTFNKK